MARQFRAQGHAIVGEANAADLVVVNTCSVTSEAAADSRQTIRHAARSGAKEIVVTGCWSTLQPSAASDLPRVVRVIPNAQKDFLVADALNISREEFDREPISREPLPGLHRRTRAFVKAQDGCDNACTFCITTVARGAARSRNASAVIEDIRSALGGGAREIVLTGVHLGSWGHDQGRHLRDLIAIILAETETPRLRLSSLEPWDLDETFFTLWENKRLMPHLHLPLQSGSASVLKRMLRKTTPDSFRALIDAARSILPDAAITTDLISGFPGETDDEFAETLDFIRAINFASGHVFTYSARPGTPASRMKDQVPHEIRKRRSSLLRNGFSEMSETYRKQFIGKTLPVLWESASELTEDGWKMEGWTPNYIRVTAFAKEARWNQIDDVMLSDIVGDGVKGTIV